MWVDEATHQSCYLSETSGGAELELRLYGFRVQCFEFPSVGEAMYWVDRWRPTTALGSRAA